MNRFPTYPLASNQYDLWMDQVLHPGYPNYNIGGYGEVGGPIDPLLMEKAYRLVVEECDALRIILSREEKSPRQHFSKSLDWVFSFHDKSGEENPPKESLLLIREIFRQPFALYGAPLFRFGLVKGGEERFFFFNIYHHLIMDGWGVSLVYQRVSQIYNALSKGEPPPPYEGHPYKERVEEDQRYLTSSKYSRDGRFWKGKIKSLPPPLIEKRYSGPEKSGNSTSWVLRKVIPSDQYKKILAFTEMLGVGPFPFFLVLLTIYFSRVSGGRSFLVGTPLLNRGKGKNKKTPGMFTSVVPMELALYKGATVLSLLREIVRELRRLYRHQQFPLSHIGKKLGLLSHGRTTLFDLIFSYEKEDYVTDFGGSAARATQLFSGYSPHALALTLCEFHEAEDMELVFEYSHSVYTEEEMERVACRLIHLIDQMLDSPEKESVQLEIMPEEERALWLKVARGEGKKNLFAGSVASLMEEALGRNAFRVALLWEGGEMSYEELHHRSNRIANFLRSEGVEKEKRVGVCMDRSPEMIIILLAILKAGGAYLPIDPDWPPSRVSFVLKDASPEVVIGESALLEGLSYGGKVFLQDELEERCSSFSARRPEINIEKEDLVYVIYTSGSTGIPKGVLLTHGPLASRLIWMGRLFEMEPRDRVMQSFQLTFDPSVHEIFLPFIYGATLVLAPPGRCHPHVLASVVKEKKVTVMAFVPSIMQQFLEAEEWEREPSTLRLACCGGEVLTPLLAKNFHRKMGRKARLFNFYGATETTILATCWPYRPLEGDQPLPVGYPIDDSRLYILDERQSPLPLGESGEICIGGDALARGYLNRDDLNGERFLPDPFRKGEGTFLYRTGDRGRIGSQGALEFMGRFDRQVKIQGYRVEPGEIESALQGIDGVKSVAVRIWWDEKGIPFLVAYVVADKGRLLNGEELGAELRGVLPHYMVPRLFRFPEALPLTTNGKVDYEALPPCDSPRRERERTGEGPETPLEKRMVQMWETLLNVQPVGRRDNFFDLGGDSLKALLMIREVEALTGKRFALSFFFERPTVAELAMALELWSRPEEGPLVLSLSDKEDVLPFYCVASGHGDIVRFARLAERLEGECSFYMLQPPMAEGRSPINMERLAEEYACLIERRNHEECRVGGFSLGGLLALEVALRLKKKGIGVHSPILLDTIYPTLPGVAALAMGLFRKGAALPGVGNIPLNGRPLKLLFSDEGLISQITALEKYRLPPCPGPLTFILSETMKRYGFFLYTPWKRYAIEGRRELTTPGFHGGIFKEENLASLATVLKECFHST